MSIDQPNNGGPVTISNWNACINQGNGEVVLSCTVTANKSGATISGVGVILNNSAGVTLGSCYTELSGGCESVTPALNLPPGDLAVGDTVMGVVTGEAHGQHYFIEQKLTIGTCS
jgi:hypothetical protein